MDYAVNGILQARVLEWVAFPFSRGSSQPTDRTEVSHLQEDSLPAEPPGSPTCTTAYKLGEQQELVYCPGNHAQGFTIIFSGKESEKEAESHICIYIHTICM